MSNENKNDIIGKGFIQGTLIELLPLNSEHVKIYNKWANDKKIRISSGYVLPTRIEAEKKSLDNTEERQRIEIHFEIWHKIDKKPIGHVAIFDISWTDRHCELGLIVGEPEYWGKGIATEAVGLLFDYCFKELNLHKIITRSAHTNIGSWKVSEKLKMKKEAILHEYFYTDGDYEDAFIYGILKNDWLSGKKEN